MCLCTIFSLGLISCTECIWVIRFGVPENTVCHIHIGHCDQYFDLTYLYARKKKILITTAANNIFFLFFFFFRENKVLTFLPSIWFSLDFKTSFLWKKKKKKKLNIICYKFCFALQRLIMYGKTFFFFLVEFPFLFRQWGTSCTDKTVVSKILIVWNICLCLFWLLRQLVWQTHRWGERQQQIWLIKYHNHCYQQEKVCNRNEQWHVK